MAQDLEPEEEQNLSEEEQELLREILEIDKQRSAIRDREPDLVEDDEHFSGPVLSEDKIE